MTEISPAASSHCSALYLALRLRPKRQASMLLSATSCDRHWSLAYQMARPTWSDFPGSFAAAESHEIGTGPLNGRGCIRFGFGALPGAVALLSLFMACAYRVTARSRATLRNVGSPRGSRACSAHQLQRHLVAHGMADYMRAANWDRGSVQNRAHGPKSDPVFASRRRVVEKVSLI